MCTYVHSSKPKLKSERYLCSPHPKKHVISTTSSFPVPLFTHQVEEKLRLGKEKVIKPAKLIIIITRRVDSGDDDDDVGLGGTSCVPTKMIYDARPYAWFRNQNGRRSRFQTVAKGGERAKRIGSIMDTEDEASHVTL